MSFALTLEQARPAVIGLGYVGLPLVLALSRHFPTTGFDVSDARVARLREGIDDSGESDPSDLVASERATFTADPERLADCNVYIVAVPTPVTAQKTPDLGPLRAATATVARVLKRGDVVVYESTVYPGATEEVCVPVLEGASGLRCDVDFWLCFFCSRYQRSRSAR